MNNRANMVKLNNRRITNKTSLIKPLGASAPISAHKMSNQIMQQEQLQYSQNVNDSNQGLRCVGKRTN